MSDPFSTSEKILLENIIVLTLQAKVGVDTKIFDWHMDSQPLTLIINVSDMPDQVEGGSTILRRHDDG